MMKRSNLVRFATALAVAGAASLYAKWALEGHIDAGAVLLISSLLIAPPVLLYELRSWLPGSLFWLVFVTLECVYIYALLAAWRWAMKRRAVVRARRN